MSDSTANTALATKRLPRFLARLSRALSRTLALRRPCVWVGPRSCAVYMCGKLLGKCPLDGLGEYLRNAHLAECRHGVDLAIDLAADTSHSFARSPQPGSGDPAAGQASAPPGEAQTQSSQSAHPSQSHWLRVHLSSFIADLKRCLGGSADRHGLGQQHDGRSQLWWRQFRIEGDTVRINASRGITDLLSQASAQLRNCGIEVNRVFSVASSLAAMLASESGQAVAVISFGGEGDEAFARVGIHQRRRLLCSRTVAIGGQAGAYGHPGSHNVPEAALVQCIRQLHQYLDKQRIAISAKAYAIGDHGINWTDVQAQTQLEITVLDHIGPDSKTQGPGSGAEEAAGHSQPREAYGQSADEHGGSRPDGVAGAGLPHSDGDLPISLPEEGGGSSGDLGFTPDEDGPTPYMKTSKGSAALPSGQGIAVATMPEAPDGAVEPELSSSDGGLPISPEEGGVTPAPEMGIGAAVLSDEISIETLQDPKCDIPSLNELNASGSTQTAADAGGDAPEPLGQTDVIGAQATPGADSHASDSSEPSESSPASAGEYPGKLAKPVIAWINDQTWSSGHYLCRSIIRAGRRRLYSAALSALAAVLALGSVAISGASLAEILWEDPPASSQPPPRAAAPKPVGLERKPEYERDLDKAKWLDKMTAQMPSPASLLVPASVWLANNPGFELTEAQWRNSLADKTANRGKTEGGGSALRLMIKLTGSDLALDLSDIEESRRWHADGIDWSLAHYRPVLSHQIIDDNSDAEFADLFVLELTRPSSGTQ